MLHAAVCHASLSRACACFRRLFLCFQSSCVACAEAPGSRLPFASLGPLAPAVLDDSWPPWELRASADLPSAVGLSKTAEEIISSGVTATNIRPSFSLRVSSARILPYELLFGNAKVLVGNARCTFRTLCLSFLDQIVERAMNACRKLKKMPCTRRKMFSRDFFLSWSSTLCLVYFEK